MSRHTIIPTISLSRIWNYLFFLAYLFLIVRAASTPERKNRDHNFPTLNNALCFPQDPQPFWSADLAYCLDFPVTYDPQDQAELLSLYGLVVEGVFEQECKKIRTVLPEVFTTEQIHLLRATGVTIKVVPVNHMPSNSGNHNEFSEAMYGVSSHTIYICFDTDITSCELKQMLRNEGYHALVHAANLPLLEIREKKLDFHNLDDIYFMISPYLNGEAASDFEIEKALKTAVKQFKDRLKRFNDLIAKKKRSSKEKKQYSEFRRSLAHYEPACYRIELSVQVYQALKSQGIIHLGQVSWFDIPGKGRAYLLELPMHYSNSNSYVLRYAFAHPSNHRLDNLETAFLADTQAFLDDSHLGGYQHLSEKNQLTELSSFMNELSKSVLKMFAPKWCMFHQRNLGIDFCR